MTATYPAFSIEKVIPLRDKEYYWYVLDRINKASSRIWMSMFLIDVRRAFDPNQEVRGLIHALRYASWRGVEVRILTGDSRTIVQLREMNMVSRTYLRTQRLMVKTHRSPERTGSHDKYLIIDHNIIILGSHNWIDESFNDSAEDSIAVFSPDLNCRLCQEFLNAWEQPRSKRRATTKYKNEDTGP